MPRRKRRSKSVKAPAKVIGDPNKTYDKTENHDGPGREPATVGFGNAVGNKFHFFVRYPHDAKEGEGRMISISWAAPYAARKYLEFIMDGEEVDWTALNKFVTSKGVEVSCAAPSDKLQPNELELALDHKYTKAERAFEVPEKDRKSFELLLRPYPDKFEKPSTGKAKVGRASPNRPEGKFITVADICEELKVQPRDGRAALRKAKVEKPEWGWAFPIGSDELKQAKTIIKKGAR